MGRPQQGPRSPVPHSGDLERILRLPRRPPLDLESPRAAAMVQIMTERLRRKDRRHDGTDCDCRRRGRDHCIDTLLPVQAWTLWEASLYGAVFGSIGVGHGKTGLDILIVMVLSWVKHAALLIPPGLIEQFVGDYLDWREHFRVPSLVARGEHFFAPEDDAPVLRVVPYSMLQRPESTVLLEEMAPDEVIGDEIHNLKNPASARGVRYSRLFDSCPDTGACSWSGTPTARTLMDFAHLLALSLGDGSEGPPGRPQPPGSPLPTDLEEAKWWAACVDPSDSPAPEGALTRLVVAMGATDARDAVRRRLVETPGYISTSGSRPCAASIKLDEREPPPLPDAVAEAMREVRRTWTRPDGEELVEALEIAKCMRELSCGFYLRWVYPDDPPLSLVDEWFDARGEWHRELRDKVSRGEPHLDSRFLCELAAERARRGEAPTEGKPVWRARHWARWADIRDKVRHETEAVWIDRWLVDDAAAWATERAKAKLPPGVIWYMHDAFGAAVGAAAGAPVFSGGGKALRAELKAAAQRGPRTIVLSINAYGTGFDGLQDHYADALVSNSPSGGDRWGQLIGRFHRRRQLADEVSFRVYRHTEEVRRAIDKAVAEAKYIQGVTGENQTLLWSDVGWALDRDAARRAETDATWRPAAAGASR